MTLTKETPENNEKIFDFTPKFNSVKQLTNVNGKHSPHTQKTKVPLLRCKRGSFKTPLSNI